MESGTLQRVRELFGELGELPAAERERRLEGEPAEVRDQVESLLASHESARSFLARPAAELLAGGDGDADPFVGFALGGYRITVLIGTGGMGAVYRADQTQPRRTVALKVIRAGWATPALRRRFAHEAEALGRLRHPGIAQIFEAGSAPGPEGRETPFFAMELVEGVPLGEYAAKRRLGLRERLALFAMVCDAAHHAHQKGIVHRDLKPGNILVEEESDETGGRESERGEAAASTSALRLTELDIGARPKILDFGIARLTDSDAAVTTMQTDPGQIVGTLAYMSPEQVRGQVDKIDTRSDVYALGVVLFELLTGRLPYEVKGKGVPEAARLIAEEEPTMPGTVDRQVRGDLETIILKAIAKEPERRYQSAAELGADVRRYLSHMPIVARPATTMYQLRKFARRNRALVGGVVTVFVVLILGVVGTTLEMLRAMGAEKLAHARELTAAAEARKSRKSVDFLQGVLSSSDPDRTKGKEMTVREMLDQAAERVGERLKDDPDVQYAARYAIGHAYRAAGAPERAEEHLNEALVLAGRLYGEQSMECAVLLHELAEAAADRHQWERVIEIAGKALAMMEGLREQDVLRMSRVAGTLAGAYGAQSDLTSAEKYGRRAYELAEKGGGKEELASAAGVMSDFWQRKGGPTASKEAEKYARMQLEILAELRGPGHSTTLRAKEALGWFLASEQRTTDGLKLLEEAEQGYRTLYGEQNRRRLNVLALMARCENDLGHPERSKELAGQAIDGLTVVAPDSVDLAQAIMRRANVIYSKKDYAGAERDFREALRIRQLNNDPRAGNTMSQLAGALENQGKLEEALEWERKAIEVRRASGDLLSDFGTMLNNYGQTLAKSGRDAEAEEQYKASIEYDRKARPGHPLNGFNLWTYALFLSDRQRMAEAEPLAREAYDLVKTQSAQTRRRLGTTLATVLEGVGKAEEAAKVRGELEALAAARPAGAK